VIKFVDFWEIVAAVLRVRWLGFSSSIDYINVLFFPLKLVSTIFLFKEVSWRFTFSAKVSLCLDVRLLLLYP